jgi:hypothetical protein
VELPGGVTILEFPMTTLSFAGGRLPFCGGGYFRLAPYSVVRAGLAHVNRREQMPGIVYLHPWEMDPGQPRLPAGRLARFRHYVNLRHTAFKLDRLLRDFTFGPAREVLSELGFVEMAR